MSVETLNSYTSSLGMTTAEWASVTTPEEVSSTLMYLSTGPSITPDTSFRLPPAPSVWNPTTDFYDANSAGRLDTKALDVVAAAFAIHVGAKLVKGVSKLIGDTLSATANLFVPKKAAQNDNANTILSATKEDRTPTDQPTTQWREQVKAVQNSCKSPK